MTERLQPLQLTVVGRADTTYTPIRETLGGAGLTEAGPPARPRFAHATPDPARAAANQAAVRRLLADRQPAFAARLARAEAALDAEMAQHGRGQHPRGPAGPQPGRRHRWRPPGKLAAAQGGRLTGPRRPDPEPDMEAGP
jgi:hypothetical protein